MAFSNPHEIADQLSRFQTGYESEMRELDEQIAHYERSIQLMENDNRKIRAGTAAKEAQIQNMLLHEKELDKKIQNAEEELKRASEREASVTGKNLKSETANELLKTLISTYDKNYKGIDERREMGKKKFEKQRQEYENKENEIKETMKTNRKNHEASISSLKVEEENLKDDLQNAAKKEVELNGILENEKMRKAAVEETIKNKSAEIERKKNEIILIEKNTNDLEKQITSIKEKLTAVLNSNNKLEIEYQRKHDQLTRVRLQAKEVRDKVSALENEQMQMRNEIKEMNTKLVESLAQNEKLTLQIKNNENSLSKFDSMKRNHKELQDIVSNLHHQMSTMSTDDESVDAKIEAKKSELCRIRSEIIVMDQEISELESRIRNHNKVDQKNNEIMRDLENEIHQINEKLVEGRDYVTTADNELIVLIQKLKEATEQRETANMKITLAKELSEKESQLELSNEELKNVDSASKSKTSNPVDLLKKELKSEIETFNNQLKGLEDIFTQKSKKTEENKIFMKDLQTKIDKLEQELEEKNKMQKKQVEVNKKDHENTNQKPLNEVKAPPRQRRRLVTPTKADLTTNSGKIKRRSLWSSDESEDE